MDEETQKILNDIIEKIQRLGDKKHKNAMYDVKRKIEWQMQRLDTKSQEYIALRIILAYVDGLWQGLGYYYGFEGKIVK